jgi:ABC-type transport system involved in multi-copper enzyme maturation permease subunit
VAGINLKAVYSIAKKEFADNVRNKWIIALIIIFAVMTLLASYVTGGDSALGSMEETVVTMISIAGFLIPIIAIMLGYASISGECENGSMGILLSYPIRRGEILLGKLVGLGFVIVVSTVVGFGVGGVVIAAIAGTEAIGAFLAFIGLTILTGFLYLSMSMLFSSMLKRRTTSLGAGVVLFFWSMIYGFIVFAIYAAGGGDLESLMVGGVEFPEWLWASVVFSPMDMYQMAVMLAFNVEKVFGISVEVPSFITSGLVVMVQLLWIEIALALAYFSFERRDI